MRSILLAVLLLCSTIAKAQQEIELWPDQVPPHSIADEDPEYVDDCWGGVRCAHHVVNPTLTLYPSDEKSDTWVIVAPGGGYDVVAIFHEGSEIAQAFSDRGISAAVLKYRVPDSKTATEPEKVPFADLRRAMEILRDKQKASGTESGKIGMVGFSASGHLGAYSMVHPNPNPDLNPDFGILIYGVSNLNQENREWLEKSLYYRQLTDEEIESETILDLVNEDTAPAFLVHATDDDVCHYTESTLYADALREKGVETEIHLFAQGGHGFGAGRDSDGTSQWIDLAVNWIGRLDAAEPGKN